MWCGVGVRSYLPICRDGGMQNESSFQKRTQLQLPIMLQEAGCGMDVCVKSAISTRANKKIGSNVNGAIS